MTELVELWGIEQLAQAAVGVVGALLQAQQVIEAGREGLRLARVLEAPSHNVSCDLVPVPRA